MKNFSILYPDTYSQKGPFFPSQYALLYFFIPSILYDYLVISYLKIPQEPILVYIYVCNIYLVNYKRKLIFFFAFSLAFSLWIVECGKGKGFVCTRRRSSFVELVASESMLTVFGKISKHIHAGMAFGPGDDILTSLLQRIASYIVWSKSVV